MTQARYDLNKRIVAIRKSGKSCRETAAIIGCKEWRVWRAMGDEGLRGKVSVYRLDEADRKKRWPSKDTRAMQPRDQAMLDEAEILDIEEWIRDVREYRRPREARIPENYLRRMERLIVMARRKP